MVEAKSLAYSIKAKQILQPLSLTFKPGLHLLIGPNGAGKTSLLKCLAGEVKPTGGEVCWRGQALNQISIVQQAKLRCHLRQHNSFTANLSVKEVVALGRLPFAEPYAQTEEYVNAQLKSWGLEEFSERTVLDLSGGEQQRVHLARTFCQIMGMDSPIILLDEPLNNLDYAWQQHFFSYIQQWVKQHNATIITSIHDLNLSSLVEANLYLMAAGTVLATGTSTEVLTEITLSQAYGAEMRVIPHPINGKPIVIPIV